jgi:predicted anti-sigma-YlaC factor YlaD
MRHVDSLLVEYHDDELSPWQRRRVEAHLQDCAACRAELERLDRLSDVLAAYTLPDTLAAAETARAQVMLRLPRRQVDRPSDVSWGWHLVPLGLICVLMALQPLLILPDAVKWIADLARWSGIELSSLSGPSLVGGRLVAAVEYVLHSGWFSLYRFGWQMLVFTTLILAFATYWGWVNVLWRAKPLPSIAKGD